MIVDLPLIGNMAVHGIKNLLNNAFIDAAHMHGLGNRDGLNALLNGSWHDIDKNLTYFDFKIVPNDQVHRNYKITTNSITYHLLIAQRCILRSTGNKKICMFIR